MDSLFTNGKEYVDFLNAIAYRRIKNLESANVHYDEEIADTIKKCYDIFEKYGAETNYIEEILKVETKMQDSESHRLSSSDLEELSSKRDTLYSNYNQFLDNLPLDVKEDLEFLFKKILDRKSRYHHTGEILKQIDMEFPSARALTVEAIFNQPLFKSINTYLNPNMEEMSVEQTDTNSLPYVVQIKEAPKSLLQDKEEDLELAEEPAPESIETDNSFYDPTDDFTTSIENDLTVPVFEEVKEPETTTIEPIDEAEPEVSDESLKYTMSEGISLIDLAIAACGDERGWEDIYENNRSVIDNRLTEAGFTLEEAKNNDSILSGLELVIPNVYNHLIEGETKQSDYKMAA